MRTMQAACSSVHSRQATQLPCLRNLKHQHHTCNSIYTVHALLPHGEGAWKGCKARHTALGQLPECFIPVL